MSQCVQGLPENQLVYVEFSDYRLPHVYFNRGILVEINIFSHIYLSTYLYMFKPKGMHIIMHAYMHSAQCAESTD